VLAQTSDEALHVFVQLVDAKGDPVKTTAPSSSPLVVTLVPSDPSVLKPYGSEGGVVRLESSAASNCGYGRFVAPKAGTVSVTASAPGFAPVSVTVEAFAGGNTPAKTRVYAVPPRIAAGFESGDYARGEIVFDRMVQSFRARRTP
jgi:hypothetical protein